MLEAGILFLLGWLIGGGAYGKKKKGGGGIAPEPRPGPAPSKPADAPWPKEPWPTQDLAARAAEEQKRKNALQARLDADAQEAFNKAKARGDQEALADIARRKKEKQAALDAMQEDINRANREAMSQAMNAPKA